MHQSLFWCGVIPLEFEATQGALPYSFLEHVHQALFVDTVTTIKLYDFCTRKRFITHRAWHFLKRREVFIMRFTYFPATTICTMSRNSPCIYAGVRLGGRRAVGPAQRTSNRPHFPPGLRRGPVVACDDCADAVARVLRGPRLDHRRPPSHCHVEHYYRAVPCLVCPEMVVQKKRKDKKDKQFTSSIVEWYLGVCASSVVCSSSFVLPTRLELAIP